MSDFVDQPLDKMMNKKSVTTAIKSLQQTVSAKPSARLDYLSEITSDFGDVVYGRFIGPQNDSGTEPTDSGFSGVFLTAYSQVMSDSSQNAWLAYVSSGSVLFSVGENGIYQNRLTQGYTHIANDGTTYRRGDLGMTVISGETAPSFGMSYQDNSTATNLITNGTFETGDLTGWTTVSAPAGSGVTSSAAFGLSPYAGTYHIKVGVTGVAGTGEYKQVVDVTAGTTYLFNCYGAYDTNVGAAYIKYFSSTDGTGSPIITETVTMVGSVRTWNNYVRFSVAPSASNSASIHLVSLTSGAGVLFDSVSFTSSSLANYLLFHPNTGDVIAKMMDNGYRNPGKLPVGTMQVLRVEETKDKVTTAVVAYAGAGVDVGTHYYIVTFVDAYGETDADLGQAASAVIAASANDQVNLTAIPLGKWGTTSRRVYRTKVGGLSSDPTAYFLLTTIGNNTTTTYSDTTPDASLSATTIPTVNTTGSRPVWPRTGGIMAEDFVTSAVGWARNIRSSHPYGYDYSTTGAVNDSITGSFMLEAGSYTLKIWGSTAASRGIYTIYIDGVSQGTQDWYAAATTVNTEKTTSVTITSSGYHHLEIRNETKNAASTSYTFGITRAFFVPTTV